MSAFCELGCISISICTSSSCPWLTRTTFSISRHHNEVRVLQCFGRPVQIHPDLPTLVLLVPLGNRPECIVVLRRGIQARYLYARARLQSTRGTSFTFRRFRCLSWSRSRSSAAASRAQVISLQCFGLSIIIHLHAPATQSVVPFCYNTSHSIQFRRAI